MCTWPVGVLRPCQKKTDPCLATNNSYVNPIIFFKFRYHVTQCSMVAEQSNHLLPSQRLYIHCACAHCLWLFWNPVTANQLHALQLTNRMWIHPCCLIPGIMLHKAAWWLNSQTTYFHHTTSITTGCACCGHNLWVYWDPVAAKQLHALLLTNNMWIQPCCLIPGIMLHKAAWWLNSQTTYFHHTTSINTVHVNMASGCTGTLSQQISDLHRHQPTIYESNHAVWSLALCYTMQNGGGMVKPPTSNTPPP